jgi:hypothetical protein
MWDRGLLFAVAALAGVALTNTVQAQQPWPPMGGKAKIEGCLTRGDDHLCIMVRDRWTGQPYAIQFRSATPLIAREHFGHIVAGTGELNGEAFCNGQRMRALANFHFSFPPLRDPC